MKSKKQYLINLILKPKDKEASRFPLSSIRDPAAEMPGRQQLRFKKCPKRLENN
jgi:hypothetical protein